MSLIHVRYNLKRSYMDMWQRFNVLSDKAMVGRSEWGNRVTVEDKVTEEQLKIIKVYSSSFAVVESTVRMDSKRKIRFRHRRRYRE